jgi:hypothetical protein
MTFIGKYARSRIIKFLKMADTDANSIRSVIENDLCKTIYNAIHSSSQISDFLDPLKEAAENGKLTRLLIRIHREGSNITVPEIKLEGVDSVATLQANNNFNSVKNNIQVYLNKNIEVFPSIYSSDTISYENCDFWIEYNLANPQMIVLH